MRGATSTRSATCRTSRWSPTWSDPRAREPASSAGSIGRRGMAARPVPRPPGRGSRDPRRAHPAAAPGRLPGRPRHLRGGARGGPGARREAFLHGGAPPRAYLPAAAGHARRRAPPGPRAGRGRLCGRAPRGHAARLPLPAAHRGHVQPCPAARGRAGEPVAGARVRDRAPGAAAPRPGLLRLLGARARRGAARGPPHVHPERGRARPPGGARGRLRSAARDRAGLERDRRLPGLLPRRDRRAGWAPHQERRGDRAGARERGASGGEPARAGEPRGDAGRPLTLARTPARRRLPGARGRAALPRAAGQRGRPGAAGARRRRPPGARRRTPGGAAGVLRGARAGAPPRRRGGARRRPRGHPAGEPASRRGPPGGGGGPVARHRRAGGRAGRPAAGVGRRRAGEGRAQPPARAGRARPGGAPGEGGEGAPERERRSAAPAQDPHRRGEARDGPLEGALGRDPGRRLSELDEPARRAAHARRHGPLRLGPDRRAREVEALQERDLHLADDAQRRQGSLLADRGGRAVKLRELWAAAGRWYAAHSARDRRVVAGIGALAALSILYVAAVQPLIHYRQRVKTEIEEGQDQLEHAARFLAVADALRAERDDLRQRVAQAKERLLPGSSGTLGAAALQERANSLAAEKGITVQSTQVMKEEPVEPFHKIAIRLTLSGELKPFAELLSGLEYGPQQLTIPFLEVSRRAAMAGAKGPRTLQGTVEVSGYLQGQQAAKAEAEPAEGEGEAPAGTAEDEAGAGAPPGRAPPGAPPGALPRAPPPPPPPSPQAPRAAAAAPPAGPQSPPPPPRPPTPAPAPRSGPGGARQP